jgi:hypothetical protein
MAAVMARITPLETKLDQAAKAMLIIGKAMTSFNMLMSLQTWQLSYSMAACWQWVIV